MWKTDASRVHNASRVYALRVSLAMEASAFRTIKFLEAVAMHRVARRVRSVFRVYVFQRVRTVVVKPPAMVARAQT